MKFSAKVNTLLFFYGRYSHHALKKAKQGDFRVQSSYRVSIHLPEASLFLIKQAQKYADRFASDCLYSRVDGIVKNKTFILMELELIEPFLFLDQNDKSWENYYAAPIQLISSDDLS